MTEDSKDCLQCRLTSGGGLLVGGAYVIYQSKKLKSSSRHIVTGIGYGLCSLAILRVFALPPFGRRPETDMKTVPADKTEETEYIIGKFPPKLQ